MSDHATKIFMHYFNTPKILGNNLNRMCVV